MFWKSTMNLKLATFFIYINYIYCANILGIFVFPTISHQTIFQAVWKQLSLKGHNVTVITPNPLNDPTLTNLTEISVSHVYKIYEDNKLTDVFSKDRNIFESLFLLFRLLNVVIGMELDSTHEWLLEGNKKFDLILIECYYPVLHALTKRFQAPIIGVSSFGALVAQNDIFGNSYHPILYPDVFIRDHNIQLSLWKRIHNVLFPIWCVFYHKYFVVPRAHKMAKQYFGDDFAYVGDLEKNMSLLYLNRNPFISQVVPLVPAMIDIGQIQIKPVKSLPKELEKILDEAREGVIYFSLGNSVRCSDLDKNVINIITQAMSELPYKVIWKWDLDDLPNQPPNVIIKKWLPQQDLLAHPNIRAFVTQGGMQSTDEAIARAVPLIVMPLIFDQYMHMQKIVDLGIGLSVDFSTVTKEELKSTIIEVAENERYKKEIKKVRNLLFDKQISGIENVVWWSEYVIRCKDVTFMKSPSVDTSWFHFFMFDVFLIFLVVVGTITFIGYNIMRFIVTKISFLLYFI